jgi:hypothetical protein
VWHGALLCVDRVVGMSPGRRATAGTPWWKSALKIAITFHLICVGWLLFRAESTEQVRNMLTLIFTDLRVTHFSSYAGSLLAFYGLPVLLFELWQFRRNDLACLTKVAWPIRAAVYTYIAVMILLFHPTETHEFIYFQF